MPWLCHLLTAFAHPLYYCCVRKQGFNLYAFNTRRGTEQALWAEDQTLPNVQTPSTLLHTEASSQAAYWKIPRDRNGWGVLSAQRTLSDLALDGRAPHFPKSTSLQLNALPPVLPTSRFLKPGIATSVCFQGFSLHWWTCFAGQEPPFINQKKKKIQWTTEKLLMSDSCPHWEIALI